MKAVVLSAGQGKRLLPLTTRSPKCLLPVSDDAVVLGFQLQALARCGVSRALVVVGFGADGVEQWLAANPVAGLAVETLYNPFYGSSDNLMTCWLARAAMDEDFVLLNGDTLFEDAALGRLLDAAPAPLTIAIDHKAHYDDDDMKVSLDERGRLVAVDKALPAAMVGAESIGMSRFRGAGPKLFVDALERAVRRPESMRQWYLSVVNRLARSQAVETCSVAGLWWREIDSGDDLAVVRRELAVAGAARGR